MYTRADRLFDLERGVAKRVGRDVGHSEICAEYALAEALI
jgi:hypothetical protein